MSTKTKLPPVSKIAQLANLSISQSEETEFTNAFEETLEVVSKMNDLDLSDVEPTHHVTGLENVSRADKVDEDRMFSQEQALQNASASHKGYVAVKQILEQSQ